MTRPAPTLRLEDAREPTDVDTRDRVWIVRLRGGDYSAFDAMFSAYADPLASYVYGLLNSREDAQEIVQDLFLWVWEHRDRWAVPGQLRTYFYRSARNRAISKIRHRRVENFFQRRSETQSKDVPIIPTAVLPEAPDRLDVAELSACVNRAVSDLPERARQVFLLVRQHHMSYAQAAEVMNISPKTVENHMARAFAGLRAALEDWK
jgi:RNA polymerase sigma-70 factor (ECF subfamily)